MSKALPENLGQWQSYLESLDPSRIELGLDRVKSVFQCLAPNIQSQIVIVAGTNGKGSTVAALQALLLLENRTVGSYLSPHLQRFNERICYQGAPVNDEELVDAFNRVEAARADTPLTYFEFITLAAIELLAGKEPDYLVFEVGLGGRLDAVNILDADVAIVTGVDLDHMDWLGSNIEKIGFEKAGVYRPGRPAVFASSDCPDSVRQHIKQIGAEPYLFGENLLIESKADQTALKVQTQTQSYELVMGRSNLPDASILSAVSAFLLLGFDQNLEEAAGVLSKVSLPGRYQSVSLGETRCILDVAHNPQAAGLLASRLQAEQEFDHLTAVVGVMSDKSLEDVFRPLLNVVRHWLLVCPDIPRAASMDQQRQALLKLGVNEENIQDVGPVSSVGPHLQRIKAAVVFGSFYTVGEFLDVLDQHN